MVEMFLLYILFFSSAALTKYSRLRGLEKHNSGGCKAPNQGVGRDLLLLQHVRENLSLPLLASGLP